MKEADQAQVYATLAEPLVVTPAGETARLEVDDAVIGAVSDERAAFGSDDFDDEDEARIGRLAFTIVKEEEATP